MNKTRVGLLKAKYLHISFKRFEKIELYVRPELMDMGETFIYEGINPSKVFNFYEEVECGNDIDEIEYYIDKYKLEPFRFIQNILKMNSSLTLEPSASGLLICLKVTDEVKTFDLGWLNIDEYWEKLTENDIKKIVRKTKKG